MKSWMVYWEEDGSRLIKEPIKIKSFKYKISPMAAWQPIIADEDKTVERGKPEIVKIKKITLPENTMVSNLKLLRNELGVLITLCKFGKPCLVEERKEFDKAVFLPIHDGDIQKGDLLGVLKVYFVEIGDLKPTEKIPEGEEWVNLVYFKDGKIIREEAKIKNYKYIQTFVYEYVPIIAATELGVKKGGIYTIDVEEIRIPSNTILDSLYIMRNALGDVLDVKLKEGFRKVEEPKTISKAIFVAVRDGRIEKGDLLGVASVHHVALKKFALELLKKEVKAKIVYADNGNLYREPIEIAPYGHEGTPNGKWELLIAEEDKTIKKGELTLIKVKDITLDPKTVVSPLFIMRHGLGAVVDVYGTGKPRRIEDPQKITHALFYPIFDGVIKRGEMIGVLKVHSVELKTSERLVETLNKIARALSPDVEELAKHPEWPYLWS
ncbi:MAG TPA: DUF22 domain-containing protein [Archaeoglobus sp.]|nr:DUF22 domain-containing protein [Archaeoglobus sp.]